MAETRIKSPGRARCQLNYPRKEQVVQVEVLDKVKAARQEVLQQYCADVLGVRGPQWTCSSHLPDSKYTKTTSDAHLANHLLTSSFCKTDMRTTVSPPRQRYDTQHYHAFTRGEVTTGWNHSTELPSRRQVSVQQQQLDRHAVAASTKHKQQLKRYISPAAREDAFALSQRQGKQAAVAQTAALIQQYGSDGAEAMQQILTMRKPDRKTVHIKTSRDDLAAVKELPGLGLAED